MKKTTLSLLFVFFVFFHANSQPDDEVCPGDITLSSQAEVNAFTCTEVEGFLKISGSDITDLSTLSGLQTVGTGLYIQNNPNLTNLDGLSSLTTILGPGSSSLIITDNPVLINVNGLSSLLNFNWTTSGYITIKNNAVLQDLTGLLALRAPLNANQSLFIDLTGNSNLDCGGFVRFFQSLGLDVVHELYDQGKILTEETGTCSLNGILSSHWGEECAGNITLSSQAEVDAFYCPEVGGTLRISGEDIADLSALSRLQKVARLIIEDNPNLTNLYGLSSLDSIHGDFGVDRYMGELTIRNNASLSNIDALSSLASIKGFQYAFLNIENNPVLENIDGLSSLSQLRWDRGGAINIRNNAILSNLEGLATLSFEGNPLPNQFSLRVTNNPLLTPCTILYPLLKSLGGEAFAEIVDRGSIEITGNGPGCTLEGIFSGLEGEVCLGNITLSSQAEVDAFFCTDVKGRLKISGNDITHLGALSMLRKVAMLVIEDNPSLTNLYGLSSLDSIYGDFGVYIGELTIRNNASLSNIDALSSLASIKGLQYAKLNIENNPSLEHIDGLSSLSQFHWYRGGSINIRNNAILSNLEGLAALSFEGNPLPNQFSLRVTNNPLLTPCTILSPVLKTLEDEAMAEIIDTGRIEISGNGIGCTLADVLPGDPAEGCLGNVTLTSQAEVNAFNCTAVGGVLRIAGNDITDLSTLSSLQQVGAGLIIENNPNLTNLDGLLSLDSIDGGSYKHTTSLIIRNNASLINIDGLSSLTTIFGTSYNTLSITNNPSLQNINGLSSLAMLGSNNIIEISITNNSVLANIDGLSSLKLPSNFNLRESSIKITNNPLLTQCNALQSLGTDFVHNLYYYYPENVTIAENGATCTLEEVFPGVINLVCTGNSGITLSSQAEVDAFHCISVAKTLRISGNDITDLSALSVLREVSGGLTIESNPNLANLDGLSPLSITGWVSIRNNASLTNIDGLSSLTQLTGDGLSALFIRDNPVLQNLDGFSSLSQFGGGDGGNIYIDNNAALESIHGLSSLRAPHVAESAIFNITITNNPSLFECGALFPFLQTLGEEVVSHSNIQILNNGGGCTLESFLSGFPYNEVCLGNITLSSQAEVDAFFCTDVKGKLKISGNDITNLGALSTLRTVAQLVIEDNPNLTNIDGLSSLDSIHGGLGVYIGELTIRNNASLSNIDGLSSLTSISGFQFANLIIENNPALENVDGLFLLSKFEYGRGGAINISNNAALSNINGLAALSLADVSFPNFLSIKISDNPLLTPCTELFPFLGTLGEEVLFELISLGNIQVTGNGEGCTLEDMIANGRPFITTFSIYDVKHKVLAIENFYDSVTLDMTNVDFVNWTIQANTYPEKIGSVQFIVNEKIKFTDNSFPYRLNRFVIPLLKPGTYTIRTEVYSKSNGRGKKGMGRTVVVKVVNSAAISGFQVVDASGNVLMELNDGDKINIKDPAFKSFSIKANTTPFPHVNSVKFWLNKKFYGVDSNYPYLLNGDKNGYCKPWKAEVGHYTLRATPYSKNLLFKFEGQSSEVNFKIVEEDVAGQQRLADNNVTPENTIHAGEEISITLYPVPVKDELYVILNGDDDRDVIVTIKNIQGQPLHNGSYTVQQLESSGINTLGLRPGVYFLQIQGHNGFRKILKFIKQ